MSEYQYVGFRAVDAPLSDDQLQTMEERSSRAEVTRWSFDNGGPQGEKLVRKHAAHLAKKHPTLRMLTGALRRKGLLP